MSVQENYEIVDDSPAVEDYLIHFHSHAPIRTKQERIRRTRWSRLREMVVRWREPLAEDSTDDYYNWEVDEEGRGQRHARILSKGNRTTKRYSRTVSCVKDRFRKLFRRMHRPSSSITEEPNTGFDADANGNEDSQVLQYTCQNENESVVVDSIENPEDIDDCLFVKGLSKYDDSWIPKMIYKVINCSWYWGDIDRFGAAVALQDKDDGYFLLRKSAQPDYLFTISFRRLNKTMHVRIENRYAAKDVVESFIHPGFDVEETSPSYTRLLDLIEHFGKSVEEPFYALPLLLCPLYRKNPLSLKDLARAAVYKWCHSYNSSVFKIDSLHIPAELMLYLKEFRFTQKIFDVCI